MKKTTNIILANAPINNGNRGCVALSITSLSILTKIFNEQGIEATIYLPDSGFIEDGMRVYHVNGLEDLEYVSCTHPPLGIKSLIKLCLKPRRLFQSIGIYKNADFILDIGQGDSFADIYGKGRFFSIDKIHRLASLFNKPYCILPQTIGPFQNESIKKKAVKSIEKAALVMTRDEQSLEYVKKIASKQKSVGHYIDVAFMLPYKKESFDSNHLHVGLNISALLWHGGYTRNNQLGLKEDYPTLVRSIIHHFLSDDKVILHLVPHVVEAERGVENDYAVSYDLQQEYANPRLILAPFFLGPCEAKSYISGMDFFMGARMHATIAAFSSGVPVVPMAYSRKFNGLFIDTLDYKYLADLKQDSNDAVVKTVKSAFDQRLQLKEIIQSRLDGVVEEKKTQLYKDLATILNL